MKNKTKYFISTDKYNNFYRKHTGLTPYMTIDTEGNVIGHFPGDNQNHKWQIESAKKGIAMGYWREIDESELVLLI